MSYYPQPDSHIKDKVKVALDLKNYATKKELEHAMQSNLDAKIYFITLKAEVGKLGINVLTNVPISSNKSKTNADDLDVGKFKTFSVDLKKLRGVVDKEVVKNTKFNTLNAKVNT